MIPHFSDVPGLYDFARPSTFLSAFYKAFCVIKVLIMGVIVSAFYTAIPGLAIAAFE